MNQKNRAKTSSFRDEPRTVNDKHHGRASDPLITKEDVWAFGELVRFCKEKSIGYGGWYEEDAVALRSAERFLARLKVYALELAPQPEAHPEDFCDRCGRPNVQSWHAPSPLWNAVMRTLEGGGGDAYSVVCPTCFAELAEAIIGGARWCFKPHDVDVRPLWVDGDGRTWDAESCLWREPNAESASVVLAVEPSRFTPKALTVDTTDA